MGKPTDGFGQGAASAVRLRHTAFRTAGMPELPKDLRQEVLRLTSRERNFIGDNKRRSDRVAHDLEAPIRPLHPDHTPSGPAFNSFIYNLSPTGLAFVSPSEPIGPLLAISMGPPGIDTVQMIGRIVRWSTLGARSYKVGVQFHFRLGGGESVDPGEG